jgi:hypothetical protein
LIPKSPLHEAGIRTEPPPSEPCAIPTRPAATAAAAPPLEPPAFRPRSQGVRHGPFSGESVNAVVPNSGVLVLPITTKPAARVLATWARSKSGTFAANALQEKVVRIPAVVSRSLSAIGTPWNGPSTGASAFARACSRAASPQTVTKAPSSGSRRSIRSR